MARYGYVIKLGGDTEIAKALEGGVTSAMNRRALASAGSEAVMRVTIHRGRGSDYWETKIAEARYLYDTPQPPRVLRWLLVGYGLICYGVHRLYHMQDRLIGGK